MERVKIFTRGTSNTFDALEEDVNDWLSENEGIEITDKKVVSAAGTNALNKGYVNCTIVLFYKTLE